MLIGEADEQGERSDMVVQRSFILHREGEASGQGETDRGCNRRSPGGPEHWSGRYRGPPVEMSQ